MTELEGRNHGPVCPALHHINEDMAGECRWSALPKMKEFNTYPRASTGNKLSPIRQHLQPPILTSKLQPFASFRMGLGVLSFLSLFLPVVQSSLSLSTIVIQTVRLYDIAANEEKIKFDHRAAVLSTTFSDASHAYSGGLDASLRE
jgi:hypothetical protein